MKKITTLAFCLSMLVCNAQQRRIDSVMTLLKEHPKKDTAMITLLRWLAFYYQDINPDRGIKIADSAIQIANSIGGAEEHLAGLYSNKAVLYWAKGDNAAALPLYAKSASMFNRLHLPDKLAFTYINTANSFISLGQFDSAITYLDKVKTYYTSTGDTKKLVLIYNNLGVIYQYKSNLPRAIEAYNEAQLGYEKDGNREGLAATYINIGILNTTLERHSKSIEYYEKALAIYKQLGAKQSVAETLSNIGVSYYQMNDLAGAEKNFLLALDVYRETGIKTSTSMCLANLAQLYADRGEYSKALPNSKLSIPSAGETYNQQIDAYNILSKVIFKAPDSVLLNNGMLPNGRYAAAFKYARISLKQATANGNVIGQYYAWQNLSDIYAAQKEYGKSLDAYKQFTVLKDSVLKGDKLQAVTRSEDQFEFDMEKILIAAHNERKQQQLADKERLNKAIIIGISIILLMAATFYLFYQKNKNKVRVAEAEIKMLLAQMNPHFIFNALNSINSYIIQNGSDSAMQSYYLVKFSKLMRMVLEASGQKEISLAKDLEILEIYLQMERRRTDNKFNYEIKTDPGFDMEKVMVPPMLLQPFAENSIWHGFTAKTGTGELDIRIVKVGKMINFIIKDNGIGRKAAGKVKSDIFTEEKESLGLAITKQRIELLNFKNQANSSMNIYDLEQGTSFEIKVPFKETQTAA